MHQLYKWAAAGLLAFSAAAPMSVYADYKKGPDFSTFDDRTDFRDETIYFAITTRFYDGDPLNNVLSWDGQADQIKNNDPVWRGDFKGLIDKLDYIKALGFTAIWITPIVQNASGFDYHGYHAMDFSKVDLRYESRKDWGASEDVTFKSLIDAAHAKGLKIVLDIVLQHTGNFGEDYLCHLFDRDQNIKNQSDITKCLIPDEEKLGGMSYWDLPNDGAKTQYSERFKYMKNTGGNNLDTKNYYHHVADAWNWDYASRWWGQIAGDCVDLNTENPAVVEYLVKCYGEFIKLGVDAFRIDTTGHISPLTFNTAFIPEFIKLGEQYKNERLDGMPFYMFGECCARYGGVIYRGQHVLSSHYYTWKSDPKLMEEWKQYDADWWAQQVVPEGAPILGNMVTCEKDPATVHDSDNVFMKNGAWHEPDYSQASGFNVIDFPMHYNFNTASQAVNIAKEGDQYYNDASWNVVYVDSHDYSPGPNDGIRFDGGTKQWAENLSLMFSFRGIPCLYYGSEVEFQKAATIDKGPLLALKESGRAYYGAYLEGSVVADGFGKTGAGTNGQVAKTLDGDLAQHIRRLNLIRQAVPALRKGQYTWDGCSANGGWAFKRAYKDSYALVAVNGGATFTGVPAGNYVDLVTGKSYTGGGTITVDAPNNQGQLRVLVKDWKGGQVGEDGKFIYATSPVSHGGNPTATDNGTTQYYTNEDAVGPSVAAVKFSPNGGTFKTETQSVTVTLTESSVAGWYQVAGSDRVNLSPSNSTSTFTVGQGMNFGETVTVKWGATNEEGAEKTGFVTYKKVDPNAAITVYVHATSGNIYAWSTESGEEVKLLGDWPGKPINSGDKVGDFYGFTFDGHESVNVIFNNNDKQTADITGITSDIYYEYDGGGNAEEVSGIDIVPSASVSFSPNGGKFTEETLKVTATTHNAVSAWYKINSGAQTPFTNTTEFTIGEGVEDGQTITVSWSATNSEGKVKTGTVKYTKKVNGTGDEPVNPLGTKYIVYFENTKRWNTVYAYAWDGNSQQLGKWPGTPMNKTVEVNGKTYYVIGFDSEMPANIIFNGGDDKNKTADLEFVNYGIYTANGYTNSNMEGGDDPIIDPIDPVEPSDKIIVYFDNSNSNWPEVYVHYWGAEETTWPGKPAQKCDHGHYYFALPAGCTGVIFNNNNNGKQTGDIVPAHNHIFTWTGDKTHQDNGVHECSSGVNSIVVSGNETPRIFNLQGVEVTNPGPGIYIVVRGKKVSKIRIN